MITFGNFYRLFVQAFLSVFAGGELQATKCSGVNGTLLFSIREAIGNINQLCCKTPLNRSSKTHCETDLLQGYSMSHQFLLLLL